VDLSRLRKEYLDERRIALEALAEPIRQKGIVVTTKAVWGHPGFQAIVNEVEEHHIDLVVSQTRKHGALSRLFLTNDDWHLVRSCPTVDYDIPAGQQHLIEEAPEFGLKQIESKLKPNLVVVGAVSRNVLTEVFIGSTTEKVIDYLECDVLLVKPNK
jgi:nucleotide-binding universal stress UspA family protein